MKKTVNSGPGWVTIRSKDRTHVFAETSRGYRVWIGAVSPETPLHMLKAKAIGVSGVKVLSQNLFFYK